MTLNNRIKIDSGGAAIGAARMNPALGYGAIPALLKNYIDEGAEDSWRKITKRIDRIYLTVGTALDALEDEVHFSTAIKKEIVKGKKLLFKPNHVALPEIDYRTHDLGMPGVCTPWSFAAAVMRWFHDRLGITYHQMSTGEAGTTTSRGAATASWLSGQKVTTEAVFEAKYGNYYGGWGFYFVRKYLAECHDPSHTDDPMNGYQDSLNGACIPPGNAPGKLLVYDLNKIDASTGRDIPVPDGINFGAITMHRAVVGGDPHNAPERRAWPGCVLVNLPKLKIHVSELFTGAVKNIGIGLYPMEANISSEPGKYVWKYANADLKIPAVKSKVPHSRWVASIDQDTLEPMRDKNGEYVMRRTGGLEATMADAVQAARAQDILMLHVVDAIEITNINHCAPTGVPVKEGFVFAGLDPVALDECCSRYMFTGVPLGRVEKVRKEYGFASDVIRKVPMPVIAGTNVDTASGYDAPVTRVSYLDHSASRGIGRREFHVVGSDCWKGGRLVSVQKHLGRLSDNKFAELMTKTMYHVPGNVLYDLQKTIFTYLELNDRLTGSDYKRQVLETFDENGDGIIDYMEKGKGLTQPMIPEIMLIDQNLSPEEVLRLRFQMAAASIRLSMPHWNVAGHTIGKATLFKQALGRAWLMSRQEEEQPDPLFPGRVFGNGKWPSFQYAMQFHLLRQIYGQNPRSIDITFLYGVAFRYADTFCGDSQYCTAEALKDNGDVVGEYCKCAAGGGQQLPFNVFLPRGFGSLGGQPVPNVKETDDPDMVLTVSFRDKGTWRGLHMSSFDLK